MLKILHISLTECMHESRLFKQAVSCAKHFNSKVLVWALNNKENTLGKCENKTGFSIIRVSLWLRKLPAFLPYQLFKYIEWFIRTFLFIIKLHPKIIVGHVPSILPIMLFYKLFFLRTKLIYDAHELEFETVDMSKFKKQAVVLIERISLPFIAKAQVVGNEIYKRYQRKYPTFSNKFIPIYNVPNYQKEIASNYFREHFSIAEDQVIFLYQGALMPGRLLEEIVNAFIEMNLEKYNKAVLVIMGYGALKDKLLQLSKSANNIFFHPAVPHNVLLKYTASADFGLALFDCQVLSYKLSMPNKVFEYIMADIPVITHSGLLELSAIVKKCNIGYVLENKELNLLQECIQKITADNTDFSANIKAEKRTFCWENEEKKLIKIYQDLL